MLPLEVLQGAEVQPEIVTGPITWYEGTWLSNTDLLFLPIWDALDPTMLRDYTENYDGVTLPDSVVDNPVAVRQARASINKLGQLAAITGRSKGIERFDTLDIERLVERAEIRRNASMGCQPSDQAERRRQAPQAGEVRPLDRGPRLRHDQDPGRRHARVAPSGGVLVARPGTSPRPGTSNYDPSNVHFNSS